MVQREPESALRETWAQDFDLVIAEQYRKMRPDASGTRSAYADDRRDPGLATPPSDRGRLTGFDDHRQRMPRG
jgi:hypothetical protein